MHSELQRYLDGEITRAELAPELHAEADAWAQLTGAARGMHARSAPADMVQRVLAALPPAPARTPAWRTTLAAWLEPREVRVRPVYGLLAAAAIAAVMLLPGRPATPSQPAAMPGVATAAPQESEAIVYVRFSFQAPDARTVTLAGDFNDWRADALALTDADGDGVWSGTFALEPGMHKYMFVIDEQHWETDPGADGYVDDGFGMRNALIAIDPPVQRAM